MQKTKLQTQIISIMHMDCTELNEFDVKLSMSDIDDKRRNILLNVIRLRRHELSREFSPMAECSEIEEID